MTESLTLTVFGKDRIARNLFRLHGDIVNLNQFVEFGQIIHRHLSGD